MLITIITDASWCPDTGAAGWGAWIVCTRGRIITGNAFKQKMRSSSAAELGAVVNAIHTALKSNLIQENDSVLIQSDSLHVVDLISKKRKIPNRPFEIEAMGFLERWVEKYKLTLRTKHVKGHTSGKTKRTWVNNYVDIMSRKHMRKKRNGNLDRTKT